MDRQVLLTRRLQLGIEGENLTWPLFRSRKMGMHMLALLQAQPFRGQRVSVETMKKVVLQLSVVCVNLNQTGSDFILL